MSLIVPSRIVVLVHRWSLSAHTIGPTNLATYLVIIHGNTRESTNGRKETNIQHMLNICFEGDEF